MHESGEMYLETILSLGRKNNIVRAVDISNEMGISKASVSRALARLKSQACIIVDSEGRIAFTEKGRRIAETIFHRHQVLTEFFMSLGWTGRRPPPTPAKSSTTSATRPSTPCAPSWSGAATGPPAARKPKASEAPRGPKQHARCSAGRISPRRLKPAGPDKAENE